MCKDPYELFAYQACKVPTKLAIIEKKRSISYHDLLVLSSQIASQIISLGKNQKVLIYLPQSIEAYASMMASLQAGAVYSPINIHSAPERNNNILKSFNPDIIITTSKHLNEIGRNKDYKFLLVDEMVGTPRLTIKIKPSKLAYVIFTSGSTGVPKGVMISRESLAHFVKWAIEAMALSENDNCSQHSNIGFDLSVLDIYGALCSGATLFPMTQINKLSAVNYISENKITVWNSVPSAIDLFSLQKNVTQETLSSLRLLSFCGETLQKNQLEYLFKLCPDVVVHNTYGPTEATVSFTLARLTKENYEKACKNNAVSIGNSIPGMQMHLVGGTDAFEGEIYVSGPQVSLGYWNDSKKTKMSFVKLISNGSTVNCYRTGDWSKNLNGYNFFSCRIDRQVKVKGYRIELDEIDFIFKSLFDLDSYSVFKDGEIYSFLILKSGMLLDDIRKLATLHLPHYALPSKFILIDKFPRNSNGKIDSNALKLIDDL